MAIDDNTSYELTGAQVKDLANKIKAKAADNTFVGATSAAPGSKGLVPQPQAGDDAKFLSGDGSWQSVTANEIDWSTINGTGIIRLGNILIQYGRHNFGSQSFNNNFWSSLQRSAEHLSFAYPVAFASEPTFTYSLVGNSQGIIGAGSDGGGTASTSPLLTFVGGSSHTGNATPVIDWIAIGPAA